MLLLNFDDPRKIISAQRKVGCQGAFNNRTEFPNTHRCRVSKRRHSSDDGIVDVSRACGMETQMSPGGGLGGSGTRVSPPVTCES